MYQMYDTTAGAVAGPVILEKRDGPAIRMFHTVLANPQTLPGQYPEQFNLLLIGKQDEETAAIVPQTPAIIATGRSWLESQNRAAEQLEIVK